MAKKTTNKNTSKKAKKIMLKCVKLPEANKYFVHPFTIGEEVEFISDVDVQGMEEEFIKVNRVRINETQTLMKRYFEKIV